VSASHGYVRVVGKIPTAEYVLRGHEIAWRIVAEHLGIPPEDVLATSVTEKGSSETTIALYVRGRRRSDP